MTDKTITMSDDFDLFDPEQVASAKKEILAMTEDGYDPFDPEEIPMEPESDARSASRRPATRPSESKRI